MTLALAEGMDLLDEEIEKMRYDLYYIKHLSSWLDVRILAETTKIVLFGRVSTTAPDAYRSGDPTDGLQEPLRHEGR